MFVKESIERLEIDLTGTCNAKCPLCARNYKSLDIQYNYRHLNEITEQLDEYVNLKYIHLVGAFSEPTLYRHFFNLCYYLVARKISIEVCTNGDTHNPEWWGKLGEILTERDSVYYSVCGSTQELHETYRVNCSLQNLIDNARAFRKTNKFGIDWIQHIKFEYNKQDLDSPGMKKLMSEFSNVNLTLTYFTRDHDTYKDKYNLDKLLIMDEKYHSYNTVMNYAKGNWANRKNKKYEINCKCTFEKSIHIDHYGNVFPCYIWREESGLAEWNGKQKDIQDFTYECCQYCEINTKRMFKEMGCEFL